MSAPTTSESTQDAARAHGSSLQRLVSPRQFHPPLRGTNRNQIHNESRATRLLSVAVSGRTVPDEDGNALLTSRKSSIETERGGKLYRKPYHDQLDALRRDPANCGRCGKPNANGKRQCDRCRDYAKRYKAKLRGEGFDAEQAAGQLSIDHFYMRDDALPDHSRLLCIPVNQAKSIIVLYLQRHQVIDDAIAVNRFRIFDINLSAPSTISGRNFWFQ